tara:strand:- start:1646 stop:1843 length:198 start_codon:yes stop_codon:yes gene_type:complete
MVPLSMYDKDQQDLIMKLAAMNLIDISINDEEEMCCYMSEQQSDTISAFLSMDEEAFVRLFNIKP